LNRGDTKTYSEMVEMLRELREMGMEVEAHPEQRLLTRAMAFTPLAAAVVSNISSFFLHTSLSDVGKLHDATKHWVSDQHHSYFDFKRKLSQLADGWMMLGRHHSFGVTFAAKHLLNVIKLWPQTKPPPTPHMLMMAEKRRKARREREQARNN
jgi:hypothetical protein